MKTVRICIALFQGLLRYPYILAEVKLIEGCITYYKQDDAESWFLS